MNGPSSEALEVAEREAQRLANEGAAAVILTGSHARGDANEHSDLDLRVVGDGPSKTLKRVDGFLVSISFLTEEEHEEAFGDPDEAGSVVPGWTSAVILHDTDSVAERLKKRAENWSWDEISGEADKWVAKQVLSNAEEVHTVLGNVEQNKMTAAAAERSQLVMGIAKLLSVHKRISYESENDLWDLVADEMGGRYGELQRKGLAQDEIGLKESIGAAMQLFGIAAAETRHLLNEQQRGVVAHASEIAGYPLPD